MAIQALLVLAEGFEEVEAVTAIDVLRRAGIEVVVAALAGRAVRGAHGIVIQADSDLDGFAADGGAGFDLLVLPGGMPGTTNLAADARVIALVRAFAASARTIGAICAAPTVLAKAGVLAGTRVTAYPGMQDELAPAVVDADAAVVVSGAIVTSQGVGTALEFALALVERHAGRQRAAELARAMVVRR